MIIYLCTYVHVIMQRSGHDWSFLAPIDIFFGPQQNNYSFMHCLFCMPEDILHFCCPYTCSSEFILGVNAWHVQLEAFSAISIKEDSLGSARCSGEPGHGRLAILSMQGPRDRKRANGLKKSFIEALGASITTGTWLAAFHNLGDDSCLLCCQKFLQLHIWLKLFSLCLCPMNSKSNAHAIWWNNISSRQVIWPRQRHLHIVAGLSTSLPFLHVQTHQSRWQVCMQYSFYIAHSAY